LRPGLPSPRKRLREISSASKVAGTGRKRQRFSIDETFDVGEDTGTPVNLNYDVPFKFTGQIENVVINLGQTKLGAADHQKLQDVDAKLATDQGR